MPNADGQRIREFLHAELDGIEATPDPDDLTVRARRARMVRALTGLGAFVAVVAVAVAALVLARNGSGDEAALQVVDVSTTAAATTTLPATTTATSTTTTSTTTSTSTTTTSTTPPPTTASPRTDPPATLPPVQQTVAPTPVPAPAPPGLPAPTGCGLTSPESQLLALMNQARTANGAVALQCDGFPQGAASSWAATMVGKTTLSHSNWVSANGNRYRVAENVGTGPSVQAIFDGFMGSPTHRNNILDPALSRVGVGVAAGGGQLWVTVTFLGAP